MGLIDGIAAMSWLPAVKVTVNGTDVTSRITGSLRSLSLTDTAGVQSDSMEIVLAGEVMLQKVALPATGAEVEIALGYGLSPRTVGTYVVEEVEASGGTGGETITIRGYAGAYGDSDGGKSGINTARSRSWPEGLTVGAIVAKIAKEHSFKSSVSAEAAKIEPGHIDQINESDMSVLSRIARQSGLIFKPGGGTLAMVKAGESTTASGGAIPSVTLTLTEITEWSLSIRRPEAVQKVVTTYRNIKTAQTVQVEVDTGSAGSASSATDSSSAQAAADKLLSGVSSTRASIHTSGSKRIAETKAKADASEAYRKSQTMRVTLPGRADITAEGRLVLSGVRKEADREWLVASVEHRLDGGGWRTSAQCELPPKG